MTYIKLNYKNPIVKRKIGKVLHEYKEHELFTKGRHLVKKRKQALAIALSEARAALKHK